jgi:hypothetical protein
MSERFNGMSLLQAGVLHSEDGAAQQAALPVRSWRRQAQGPGVRACAGRICCALLWGAAITLPGVPLPACCQQASTTASAAACQP